MASIGISSGAVEGNVILAIVLTVMLIFIALLTVITCACCRRGNNRIMRSTLSTVSGQPSCPPDDIVPPPPVPVSPEQKLPLTVKCAVVENAEIQPNSKTAKQVVPSIRPTVSNGERDNIDYKKGLAKKDNRSHSTVSISTKSISSQQRILMVPPEESMKKNLDGPRRDVPGYVNVSEFASEPTAHQESHRDKKDMGDGLRKPDHDRIPVSIQGIWEYDARYKTVPDNDLDFVDSHRSITVKSYPNEDASGNSDKMHSMSVL